MDKYRLVLILSSPMPLIGVVYIRYDILRIDARCFRVRLHALP